MRLVTPAVVSERFKVNCSIAKRLIRYAAEKNLVRALDSQSKQLPLFTGVGVELIQKKVEAKVEVKAEVKVEA